MSEDIQRLARNTRRSAQFPPGSRCYKCGASDYRVLVAGSKPTVCYQCRALADGKSGFEEHHLFGRNNSPLRVEIPADMHRRLSAMQDAWPRETLMNPSGDPCLKMAATMRVILDLLKLAIDYALGWMPETVERLSTWFREKYGESYWLQPDLAVVFAAVPAQ